MPTRICLHPDCPEPAAYRGRCSTHARQNDQAIRRAGRRVYNTKRWRVTRERVLSLNPLCWCGAVAQDVHHRVDIAAGGDPFALTNLEALCHAHHSQHTRAQQTGAER